MTTMLLRGEDRTTQNYFAAGTNYTTPLRGEE
jgi:hypothetical protein